MEKQIELISEWLRRVFGDDKPAVIAVSGGVDSAVALTLLVKAIGKERVIPMFLPYGEQNMEDARIIVERNGLSSRAVEINIGKMVNLIINELGVEENTLRKGNVMARVRMITIFDRAKKMGALVSGTENKSEHYLGYFTRFGDEASDVEPLRELYKTEVWEIAKELGLPETFYIKDPSAGLWEGQTDEKELGFGYREADQVLRLYIDEKLGKEAVIERLKGKVGQETVRKVIGVVEKNAFKREVPYVRLLQGTEPCKEMFG